MRQQLPFKKLIHRLNCLQFANNCVFDKEIDPESFILDSMSPEINWDRHFFLDFKSHLAQGKREAFPIDGFE